MDGLECRGVVYLKRAVARVGFLPWEEGRIWVTDEAETLEELDGLLRRRCVQSEKVVLTNATVY